MNAAVMFVRGLRDSLAANMEQDGALDQFVAALDDVPPVPTDCVKPELRHPLLTRLDDALDAARGPSALLDAVAALSSADGWYQVYTGQGINAEMADFMLAKQVVGRKGPVVSSSMYAGIFLLAPNFEYRLHDHAALEIYYVHSGTVDIQNGIESAPRRLQPGQYSITPSETPHALYTGDAPVLLLYVWIGDIAGPIWWWVQGENGNWTKTLAKKT